MFIDMSEAFIDNLYNQFKGFSKYNGYIIGACDGSICQLPNHPTTKKAFKIAEDTIFGRHLSRGRISCILDVNSNHILTAKIESRKVNEIKLAIEHLDNLKNRLDISKLITIYDRAYGSTELMIHTIYLDSKFLIRLNDNAFKKKINQMNCDDGIIEINISKRILKKITDEKVREYADEMGRLKIRIVKVELKNGTIETLATNLDMEEFSKEDLKELYGKRWMIETGYDKLKNLVQIEEFSGIRRVIIEQDFYAGIFTYNIATTIQFDIQKSRPREIEKKGRIYKVTVNFSVIVTLIYDYFYDLVMESLDKKEKIMAFILLKASKELSYNEIKEDDELKKIVKPDYSTKHSGFKKKPMH